MTSDPQSVARAAAIDTAMPEKRPRIRLRAPSLHLGVADRLRSMILEGELDPGAHLVEASLCKLLKVSRTPLREALKVLATEELVEFSPHRGARITILSAQEARELFETIAGLESLAAELAAARMSAEALEELNALHAAMRGHFDRNERPEYFALNSRIHQGIVTQAGNSVLKSTHERLMYRASRGRYMAILSPGRWVQAMEEHEAVMEAFRQRDSAAAARIWRVHLSHTGEEVEHRLNADALVVSRARLRAAKRPR